MHYTGMAAPDVVCPPTAESALQPLNSTNALTQLPVLLVMLIVVISFALTLNRMSSRQFKA